MTYVDFIRGEAIIVFSVFEFGREEIVAFGNDLLSVNLYFKIAKTILLFFSFIQLRILYTVVDLRRGKKELHRHHLHSLRPLEL